MVSKNLLVGIKIVIGQWNIDIWWVSQAERVFVILVLLYRVDAIENHNDIRALLSRNEGTYTQMASKTKVSSNIYALLVLK
jgi:hypothetical protein